MLCLPPMERHSKRRIRDAMAEAPYQTIKRHITTGSCRAYGHRRVLPSEHELCRSFRVSRMTVNRAMRELAAEHLVRRVPGLGTFVAEPVAESSLVEIRSIAAEIAGRGHQHHAVVQTLERVTRACRCRDALGFDIPAAGQRPVPFRHRAFRKRCLPIQYEDKLVDPASAPDYLAQDFTKMDHAERISVRRGAAAARWNIGAGRACPGRCRTAHLAMPKDAPCLLVVRRTWSRMNGW